MKKEEQKKIRLKKASSIKIWWKKATWDHEDWASTNIWTTGGRKQWQAIKEKSSEGKTPKVDN